MWKICFLEIFFMSQWLKICQRLIFGSLVYHLKQELVVSRIVAIEKILCFSNSTQITWLQRSTLVALTHLVLFVDTCINIKSYQQGLQTSSYVLCMEMFLPAYRGVAGAMLEVFWGIAVMLVAPIAYLLQNWRYIQLAISLPSVLAIAYIW